MQQIFKLLIGISILILGFFIGHFLAKYNKEELKQGQKWFRLIIIGSLLGAVITVFFKNDILMFSFLFIAIVTVRSLRKSS